MIAQVAQETVTSLSTIEAIVWVLVGILISLILPIAVKVLKTDSALRSSSFWEKLANAWKQYSGNKYLAKLLTAVFIAIVLVLLLGLEFSTIRDAALAGFAWESLTNKLFGR